MPRMQRKNAVLFHSEVKWQWASAGGAINTKIQIKIAFVDRLRFLSQMPAVEFWYEEFLCTVAVENRGIC